MSHWLYSGNPNEPMSEAERQQLQAYEEWLMQYSVWLATQVKACEAQLAKARKSKKSLNAKQRQVCILF